MTTYEPYEAAVAIERSLRQLLEFVFTRRLGGDWYEDLSNAPIRRNAATARLSFEEVAAREGREAVTASELDFTRLDDLLVMARKQWLLLEPVLGALADIDPLLNRAATYRNDVMHGRPLPPSARDILSGIAVEVQNRIGTFMSNQDPAGAYFPSIIAASDSHGRVATSAELANGATGLVQISGHRTVHMGDTVELEATATDPARRDIEWTLDSGFTHAFDWAVERGQPYLRVSSGEPARFTHTFTAPSAGMLMMLLGRAVDAQYHQHGEGSADVRAMFSFRVLPPRREVDTSMPTGG